MRSFVATLFVVFIVAGQSLFAAERLGDESRVLGYQQCMDCHERPFEAWMQSSHANRSLEMLTSNSRANRFARRLNIEPAELTRDSVCTDCHGTRQRTDTGKLLVKHGVSCESCHGPAGANESTIGWYDLHSGESDHELPDTDRISALRDAGMAGVVDIYSVAVRCYACHSISNEQVVNVGHLAGTPDFELTTWFSGEVRHNFAPYTIDAEDSDLNMLVSNVWLASNDGSNPKSRKRFLYVVGQLADLQVNLQNRAKATTAGTFATSAAGRSMAAKARLKQIAKRIDSAELYKATDAVNSVQNLLFLPPDVSHQSDISAAALRVEQAARDFVARFDGQQLKEIESLLPQESKGLVYQP